MNKLLFSGLILLMFSGSLSRAAVRHVPSEYPSIQQGISACVDGDTLIVAPGVYYETINFSGKDIVVRSSDPNDPKVVGYTIINADEDGTAVTFENGETAAAVLIGFTITGGVGTLVYDWDTHKEFYGGGIYCSYNASPTITRNVITRNHCPYSVVEGEGMWSYTYSFGGGIGCQGGQPTITHNIIYNNSSYQGGGIYVSEGTIVGNVIYKNAAAHGGGVSMYMGTLTNNTIVGNDCSKEREPGQGRGGNVYASLSYYNNYLVANNIICGAASGTGIFCGTGPDGDLFRCNNVWDNAPSNYSTIDVRTNTYVVGEQADMTGRFGNISEDPLFVNAWNNDYHIESTSPCVSAGDPNLTPEQGALDIDGDPRVYALRVDIGADEHIGYVKPLAHAGADRHILAPEAVTLDGSQSYFSDPDGVRLYQWTQTKGEAVQLSDPAAAAPTFTPPAEGWYTFALTVDDGQYTSLPASVLVVVGNERPVADAGTAQLWPVPGYILLDGSRSSDADPPDELVYTWTQLEGPEVVLQEADSATAYFECNTPGRFVFELVVSDGFVASEPDTVKIEGAPFTLTASGLLEDGAYNLTDYDQGYFYYASVSGTRFVCAGNVDGYPDDWAIHCTDTKTGHIEVFEGGAIDLMPKMDGRFIVWAGGSGRYYNPMCTSVFLGDLSTGDVKCLRQASSTESYGYPAISGRKVLWLQHHNVDTANESRFNATSYDVCGADLSEPKRPFYFTVAEDAGHCPPYPYRTYNYDTYEDIIDVSGDIVVWEGDGDIFGADISDLDNIKVFPICTAPERQYDPAVSGDVVVWTDERNDIGDVYGADISDRENVREFEVWVGFGPQLQPDVDGAMIVFLNGDDRYGDFQAVCISREYGLIDVELYQTNRNAGQYYSYYGGHPQLDGTTLLWHYGSRVRGVSLGFAYGLAEGPVSNATTGRHYDYIQHAIDAATPGDAIVVPEGLYHEKLRLKGKGVTVTSTDPADPAVRAATVVTGAGSLVTFTQEQEGSPPPSPGLLRALPDSSVTLAGNGDGTDVLAGLTIAGGSYGVYCSGASPVIRDCTIVDNACAGVKLWDKANPTVECCDIIGNGTGIEMWAHRGGRFVDHSYVTARHCVIAGSRHDGIWGGIPTLENCTVADNAGHAVRSVRVDGTNSIVHFNNGGGENLSLESAVGTVTYSDIQGGWPGEGNIDADPLFVANGFWQPADAQGGLLDPATGWIRGDYHLKSQGWSWDAQQQNWAWHDVTSPCIDAGDPSLPPGDELPCASGDPLSERAGPNVRTNMGAYGGTCEASLAPHGWSP
ncbi:MAG: right-handed parallel beta-helix repeat-containing protein [Sedimentisphaerales bacterium]|nr:right-handed parallel beta-helix repeat-containing protein [Sedimentisphaerales bacterium]